MGEIREILREAADVPSADFDFDTVYRQGRRRRRLVIGGRAIAALVIVLGALGGLVLLQVAPHEQVATGGDELGEEDWQTLVNDELGYSVDSPVGWFSETDSFSEADWSWGGLGEDLLMISNAPLNRPEDLCASAARLPGTGVLLWLQESFTPTLAGGEPVVSLDANRDENLEELESVRNSPGEERGPDDWPEGCSERPLQVRVWPLNLHAGGRFIWGYVIVGPNVADSDSDLALVWEALSGFQATPGHKNFSDEHLIDPGDVDFVAQGEALWEEIGAVVETVFDPSVPSEERERLLDEPLSEESAMAVAELAAALVEQFGGTLPVQFGFESIGVYSAVVGLVYDDLAQVEFNLLLTWDVVAASGDTASTARDFGPFLAEVARGDDGQWRVTTDSYCAIIEPLVTSCQ